MGATAAGLASVSHLVVVVVQEAPLVDAVAVVELAAPLVEAVAAVEL